VTSADELRRQIVETSFANGGHLASSLGAVELAMALAEVFEPTKDRVLWDVGHQAYAWKLLTGRAERFSTIRTFGGLAPFPLPSESAADASVSGHAGSALPVAVGMASARDRRGTDEHVVAVVGDASMANGHSFEALNNCAALTKKLILVLNDNEMSISRPVGALSGLLAKLLTNVRYNRVKAAAEKAGHKLGLTFFRGIYHRIESRLKGLFLASHLFEQFGFRYIGPVDGHDRAALVAALTVAKEDKRSVVVHVFTKKGKGFGPAELHPTEYHGISAGGPKPSDDPARRPGWSETVGTLLGEAARANERIVALTAGMRDGTGLSAFAREFPTRFIDVGIAEGCLVSVAAGLAASGLRPVVCLYSTFLQRAVDQIIHDVATASLPVVFCIDRAGVVGADGVTHQGLYDYAILKGIPNVTICQPCDGADLKRMLDEAFARKGPTVIRYPRGTTPAETGLAAAGLAVQVSGADASVQIWATGDCLAKAQAVAARTGAGVVYARSLKPFDSDLLARQRAAGKKIVSLENGCVVGGFGETIGADLRFGWPDAFIPHGSVTDLEKHFHLDIDSIVTALHSLTTNS